MTFALQEITHEPEASVRITAVKIGQKACQRSAERKIVAQAIMTVLGRRFSGIEEEFTEREGPSRKLDLSHLNLPGITVIGGWFKGVSFEGANLERAVLRGCHFESAEFKGATLMSCDLRYCYFGTFVSHSNGSKVSSFNPSPFRRASLEGANFFCAKDLEPSALVEARIDVETHPPTDPAPSWWPRVSTERK